MPPCLALVEFSCTQLTQRAHHSHTQRGDRRKHSTARQSLASSMKTGRCSGMYAGANLQEKRSDRATMQNTCKPRNALAQVREDERHEVSLPSRALVELLHTCLKLAASADWRPVLQWRMQRGSLQNKTQNHANEPRLRKARASRPWTWPFPYPSPQWGPPCP